ncbi:hypothetical protein C4568_04890 [Candidatus Parcubacteria bacterium]|nr:MAG: hypothetical protein C4568_04890 [Candidatus Parcubacteria bacterium]
MEGDSEQKILQDWNRIFSEPPHKNHEMLATTVSDIYRRVLKFAKAHGKPEMAKAKASLNRSEDELNKTDTFVLTESGALALRRAKPRPVKRQDHVGSKIMFDFLHRIRLWKKK